MYSRGRPAFLFQRFSPVAVLLQYFFQGGIIRISRDLAPCGFKIGIFCDKAPSPFHIPGFASVPVIDLYRTTPEFTAEPRPGLKDGTGEAIIFVPPEERAPGRIPHP